VSHGRGTADKGGYGGILTLVVTWFAAVVDYYHDLPAEVAAQDAPATLGLATNPIDDRQLVVGAAGPAEQMDLTSDRIDL
jgi:hypothetical protein